MDALYLEDILRCSLCGSEFDVGAQELRCRGCAASFPVVDGFPILTKDSTIGTNLDQLNDDEPGHVTAQLAPNEFARWSGVIEPLGLANADVLEIGCGKGALTAALCQHPAIARVVATDVSHVFLRAVGSRTTDCRTPAVRVECDANERIFRSEAFDLVVGRSVLHHLLDYDVMLKACHEVLKPGGAVVLFEPVLEGKTIVNLLMALMLRFDVRSNEGVFSQSERQRLLEQITHQRKAKAEQPTREQLATFEDKYIFEIEQLCAVGRAAGFSSVEFRNNGELDATYWGYLAKICQSIGLPDEKVALYRWIGRTFADVYSVVFPDQLVTPMGFFVFRK